MGLPGAGPAPPGLFLCYTPSEGSYSEGFHFTLHIQDLRLRCRISLLPRLATLRTGILTFIFRLLTLVIIDCQVYHLPQYGRGTLGPLRFWHPGHIALSALNTVQHLPQIVHCLDAPGLFIGQSLPDLDHLLLQTRDTLLGVCHIILNKGYGIPVILRSTWGPEILGTFLRKDLLECPGTLSCPLHTFSTCEATN